MRIFCFVLLMSVCGAAFSQSLQNPKDDQVTIRTDEMVLPAPYETKSTSRLSRVVPWGDGKPQAPRGFSVQVFASHLKHPRQVYQLPNGFVLVAESDDASHSANQLRLLIDSDHDGRAEESHVFATGLNQPYGIAYADGFLYVGVTDGLWKFPYKLGEKKLTAKGQRILSLPAGGYNHHWTRNVLLSPEGKALYVSVGSASNVGEYGLSEEKRRAAILKVDLNGGHEEVVAEGLRNPVGMSLSAAKELWTVVNERDGLGDRLVPDYLTRVSAGDFYGWPFYYYGSHVDPRWQDKPRPDKKARLPDVALGSHTASLGLAFYLASQFPVKYRGGAFVSQHGSWNRSELTGYRVLFIPFKNGKPSGNPEVFLTGFIADASKSLVHGRPVGLAVLKEGSLLVADDAAGVVWSVRNAGLPVP